MKTYTFKIKVSSQNVVAAVHMQLEQFFDSMKLTDFSKLLEKYPYSFITASDYKNLDVVDSSCLVLPKAFVSEDEPLCSLRCLVDSKDFRSFLTSSEFFDFYGSEAGHNDVAASQLIEKADNYFIEVLGDDKSAEE